MKSIEAAMLYGVVMKLYDMGIAYLNTCTKGLSVGLQFWGQQFSGMIL
jgi:hypothetical protein